MAPAPKGGVARVARRGSVASAAQVLIYRPARQVPCSSWTADHIRRVATNLADRSQAMTDQPNDRANQHAAARAGRLRNALRENLKRRKSQARGRADQPADSPASDTASTQDLHPGQADPDQESQQES